MLTIKAPRDRLLASLQSVTGIVERRHTLPILSNVLIEAAGNRATFLATDLEVQVRTGAELSSSARDAASTVSARKLLDILRQLPADAEVSLDEKDGKMAVRAGKSRFSLQTLPAGDFPRMAPGENVVARITLAQRAFKELLHLAQFAMALQDIRYYLNGLLLTAEGDRLTAVATDGHRLSHAATALAEPTGKIEVILPRKTVTEMQKLLAESDDPVTITVRDNLVSLAFAGVEVVSKVIDGKFPDYTKVIPTHYTTRMKVSGPELQAGLQRAAILANEKLRGVQLEIITDQLSLICSNSEQEEAREEIAVEYAAAPLTIGFNLTYLADVLTHVGAGEIEVAFGDANSSALITLPGRDDFKYVVMPMRI